MYNIDASTKFIPVIESLLENSMQIICNQQDSCSDCEYGKDRVEPKCWYEYRNDMISALVKECGEEEVRKYEIDRG